jgi:hypothetical protein
MSPEIKAELVDINDQGVGELVVIVSSLYLLSVAMFKSYLASRETRSLYVQFQDGQHRCVRYG